jgi:hypothetical protein
MVPAIGFCAAAPDAIEDPVDMEDSVLITHHLL